MPEPQRGRSYEFSLSLVSSSTGQLLASPPLVAGDFRVSKDHGAWANLTTLPTVAPAGSILVRVQLSATEMTADQVDVWAHDVEGVWEDVMVQIQPTRTLGSDALVLLSSEAQLALAACAKLADVLARRHTSAIETSGDGDALDINSLYGALAMLTGHKRDTTSNVDALTVYQSDGVTELAQVPLLTDVAAIPIVAAGGEVGG